MAWLRLRSGIGLFPCPHFVLVGTLLACLSCGANAQTEPDRNPVPISREQAQAPSIVTPAQPRAVSVKRLMPNIADDQTRIWTFPVQLAKGKHWRPALAIIGVAAGLMALDAHDTPHFRRTDGFSGFNRVFSGKSTSVAIGVVPASFCLAGIARHDTYMQQTTLLAGEALADAFVLSTVMKGVTRRSRPSSIPPDGDFSDTWLKTGWGSAFSGHASFPSGHAIAAFSVATVFARRYGKHRWVPWVAYGLSGLVGFSRVTNQAHFPSDVFVGAALGYSISRFAVLRR
jgi:hypothetical protein